MVKQRKFWKKLYQNYRDCRIAFNWECWNVWCYIDCCHIAYFTATLYYHRMSWFFAVLAQLQRTDAVVLEGKSQGETAFCWPSDHYWVYFDRSGWLFGLEWLCLEYWYHWWSQNWHRWKMNMDMLNFIEGFLLKIAWNLTILQFVT